MTKDKIYLGDAVYVKINPYGDVVLTTEDGISVSNSIILDPTVLQAFLEYIERSKNE